MRVDKLFTLNFNRANDSSINHDIGRGVLNGLLIVGDSHITGDNITVKVRGMERTEILANRLNLSLIGSISDMEYGVRTLNGPQYQINHIFDKLNTLDGIDITDDKYQAGNKAIKGMYLDLGHISLGQSEMEIQLNTVNSEESDNYYSVYSVYREVKPDVYKQYDETKDYDTVQHSVRKVYFHSTDFLVSKEGVYNDIEFQIDTDSGTYLSDLKGLLNASNIFSETEYPEAMNVKLYSDELPVPGDVRLKINGADPEKHSLVFEREIIPSEVSKSTVENYEKLLRRVEKLEAENSELAKRYRHAGLTQKSEEMASAIEQIKGSNERDKQVAS